MTVLVGAALAMNRALGAPHLCRFSSRRGKAFGRRSGLNAALRHLRGSASEMLIWGMLLVITPGGARAQTPVPANLALHAKAAASSVLDPKYSPEQAVDGEVSNDSRWVSARTPGPHTLTLELGAKQKIGCVQLVTGWIDGDHWTGAATNFALDYWSGTQWTPLPGAAAASNTQAGLSFPLAAPIETERLRFVSADSGPVRVVELRALAPSPSYPPTLPPLEKAREHVPVRPFPLALVNQSGYNLDWPKRFTVPTIPDGAEFVVTPANSTQALFRGKVAKGIGDFTAFQPRAGTGEFVVRVLPAAGEPIVSDPFAIAPLWLERVALEPALRFWLDARGVVGSHASAFGGGAWRDGPYYTYDVPSLVLLYLANPAFFENAPVEVSHAADQKRVLDPAFKLVSDQNSDGALEAARRYYRELDGPVGERVPDLVQMIHWGIGYFLIHPENFDFSADPLGRRLHPQQVEKFAFFLYAHPYLKRWFTDAFYQRARGFAFAQWDKVGLFNVLTNIGDFKGRECPGHSILPNLMMYEVARREGRPDAERFFQAAAAQTEWVVNELDLRDPRVTKGQRMSEHMLITGLVAFQRDYPDRAPAGLRAKLAQWAAIMIARSDNLWDFRRYDEQNWSLPRYAAGTHGGAGWNEPGNIAGFPALALGVASVLDDPASAARLKQLAASHWDNLFGRNPIGAHSAYQGPRDFMGVERGYPKKFPDNVCARLELVRGTLNSTATGEQYPFNPQGDFRHAEGWTAFNAAFNVGLAFTCWEDTRVRLLDEQFKTPLTSLASPASRDKTKLPIELVALVTTNRHSTAEARVLVTASPGDQEWVTVRQVEPGSTVLRGTLAVGTGEAKAGDGVLQIVRGGRITASYGYGLFRRSAEANVH